MRSFLLILFVLSQVNVFGHSVLDNWSIAPSIRWSNMIKHTSKFTGPISDHCIGAHVDFLFHTNGKYAWHEGRNYPTIGFGVAYLNMMNPDVYGSAFGIYPLVIIPLWKNEKLNWNLQLGMGGALLTKHFERLPSPAHANVAIGSTINNYTPLQTDLQYKLNDKVHLFGGANFTHMSNASFKHPNLGINLWGAMLGLRYFPKTDAHKIVNTTHGELRPRNNVGALVRTSIAMKESSMYGGPRVPSYLIDAGIYKKYNHYNRISVGVAMQYHEYKYLFHKSSFVPTATAQAYARQWAVYANHEFIIGRLGIITQIGYYLGNPESKLAPFYQKIGGQYYVYQNQQNLLKSVYLNILLKTHTSNAELMELGFGISF